ncbi:hypothetical protein K438DRAFT_1981847 [Mycena galopus ATCC 62051]|nr:hypothetical protein K438DRAFT_1981847 [Mycena galopus ATCC 62051]
MLGVGSDNHLQLRFLVGVSLFLVKMGAVIADRSSGAKMYNLPPPQLDDKGSCVGSNINLGALAVEVGVGGFRLDESDSLLLATLWSPARHSFLEGRGTCTHAASNTLPATFLGEITFYSRRRPLFNSLAAC